MGLDRRAHVHDIDGVLRECVTDIRSDRRFTWTARRESIRAGGVRVDDRYDAAACPTDCMRVPSPHQTRAHHCSTNGGRGARHGQAVVGRSAPMCIPDKALTSSLSSRTRRPVVAE